jgi:Zn-dependent protease
MRSINIKQTPTAWVMLAFSLIIIPLNWLVAWLIATAIHECGHILALKTLKIPIRSISFNGTSIQIEAELDGGFSEILSSVCGPLCGFLLVLTASLFPRLAICAFVQTCYNMLPFENFDGGRILRCCLNAVWGSRISNCLSVLITYVAVLLLCALSICLAWCTGYWLVVGYLLCNLIYRSGIIKYPCKQDKLIVQ